jgi:hypothetical protein
MLLQALPSDVELYILEYLILPLDIEVLRKISKKVKKIINNTKYIIEKNRITEQIFMHIEDDLFHKLKSQNNIISRSSLADCWSNYYKWAWNRPTSTKVIENKWSIGDFVDVKDKVDVWGAAYIRDIQFKPCEEEKIETKLSYNVEFLGWSEAFDEWVFHDKIEKLGTKTFNPIEPYQSLQREESNWVLYNYESGWTVAICSQVTDFKEEGIKLKIQQYNDRSTIKHSIITKDNIYQNLKPITNISTLLCVTEKDLKLYNRKILM